MAEPSDPDRDLQTLGAELRKLEAEYNLFFSGGQARPPWESRTKFESQLKRVERLSIDGTGARFRLQQLQARYAAFVDLWDRGLRAREEGRPGPFARRGVREAVDRTERSTSDHADRIVFVTSFVDPLSERDKLQELFSSLTAARSETGENPVPFHRFVDLVRDQVRALRSQGTSEVALRVAVKDGHVHLTARALKGMKQQENVSAGSSGIRL